MSLLALLLAAGMATAAPHGHAMMHGSAMHSAKMHGKMHSSAMHSSAMHKKNAKMHSHMMVKPTARP